MAYSPTTWNTNDVITKDKLNKMEQGIVSASKLSGTDIDTDKDWNGKNITNVGALDTLTGNVGARTEFVDIPGDVVRKTINPGISLYDGAAAVDIATFVVPANYSTVSASSNARIVVSAGGSEGRYMWGVSITILRNGTSIGTGNVNYQTMSGSAIDTTGGFKAGDTLTVRGEYTRGGDPASANPIPILQVSLRSARSKSVPALRVFTEAGTW
ncbi:MAG TPA: hypothetical protein GX530_07215 [Corynebacteriales bacterium]|nr:hypothetical protein [Mycobacteriales bacterium]